MLGRQENLNEMLKLFKFLTLHLDASGRSLHGILFQSVPQFVQFLIREDLPLRRVY